MRFQAKVYAGVVLALLGAIAPAQAQLGGPPSALQCQSWTNDLAVGGSPARSAVTYGRVAACPGAVEILSGALQRAAGVRDTSYLFGLALETLRVRDVALLTAASRLALDPRAAQEARATGILVMVGQLGAGFDYPGGVSRSELLTRPLPRAGLCGVGIGDSGGLTVNHALPDDAPRRLAQVLDAITMGEDGPALVKNLARCSRSAVGSAVPLQIDLRHVRVRYLCGNRYTIGNSTPYLLFFSFTVTGSDESGDIDVQPRAHRTVALGVGRPVRFSYDGHAIATVVNEHRTCRPADGHEN